MRARNNLSAHYANLGGEMQENPKKLLIVEDEPDMCWALEKIGTKCGYQCLISYAGQGAIKKVRKHRFPMVIIDAKLPDMDGLHLASQVRKLLPDALIFVISGYFTPGDPKINQRIESGIIDGFIGKPFDNNEIVNRLKQTP